MASTPSAATIPTSASVQARSSTPTPSTSPACGPKSGIPVVRVTSQRITTVRLPATTLTEIASEVARLGTGRPG